MYKKILISIVLFLFLLPLSAFAVPATSLLPDSELVKNEDNIAMMFDGKIVSMAYSAGSAHEYEPKYYPISYYKNFGIAISVDTKTKYITMSKDNVYVKILVGSKKAFTNIGLENESSQKEKEFLLDYAPIVKNGSTYLYVNDYVQEIFDLATVEHNIANLKISNEWHKKTNDPNGLLNADGTNFSIAFIQFVPIKYSFSAKLEGYNQYGHQSQDFDLEYLPINETVYFKNDLYVSSNFISKLFKELYYFKGVTEKDGFLNIDLTEFKKLNESTSIKIDLNNLKVFLIKNSESESKEEEINIKKLTRDNVNYICINEIFKTIGLEYSIHNKSYYSINNNDKTTKRMNIYPQMYEPFEGLKELNIESFTGKSLFLKSKELDMKFLYNLYKEVVKPNQEAYISIGTIGIGYKNVANELDGDNIISASWDGLLAPKSYNKTKQRAIAIDNYLLKPQYKKIIDTVVDNSVSSVGDRKVIKDAMNKYYSSDNRKNYDKWLVAPNGTKYYLHMGSANRPCVVIIIK